MPQDMKTTQMPLVPEQPGAPQQPGPEGWQPQGNNNKNGRSGLVIVIVILAIIIAILLLVFGSQACSSDDKAASQQPAQQTTQQQQTPQSSSSDQSASSSSKTTNADVKISDLNGQIWSNAQKILKSRNADLSDPLILTDDGKEPVVDANWTVESITLQDNGQFEIHLTHTTDSEEQAANAANDAAGKAKDAYNKLKESVTRN